MCRRISLEVRRSAVFGVNIETCHLFHKPLRSPRNALANYSHVPLGWFKVDILSILFLLGCEGIVTCASYIVGTRFNSDTADFKILGIGEELCALRKDKTRGTRSSLFLFKFMNKTARLQKNFVTSQLAQSWWRPTWTGRDKLMVNESQKLNKAI